MKKALYVIFSLFSGVILFSCDDGTEPIVAVPARTNCIGELDVTNPIVVNGLTFNMAEFEEGIYQRLSGKCTGYQFAFSHNGVLMRNKAYGWGRIPEEGTLNMSPCLRMNIASVSKTITAAAALKVMEQMQISVDDPIAPYLPADWTLGPGAQNVTFRQLFTHNSGFQSNNSGPWNTLLYSSLRNMVAAGTGTNMNYLNANYALFRILIPGMLTADKSLLTESFCNTLYRNYVNEAILNPVGVNNAGFTAASSAEAVSVYNYSGERFSGTGYNPDNDNWEARAGGSGWVLSAIDLNRFLDGIRFNDAVFSPANRTLMQTITAVPGFGNSGLGVYPINTTVGTAYTHDGGIQYGGGQGYTAVIYQFPGGINASLLINSIGAGSLNADNVLLNAFNAAWH